MKALRLTKLESAAYAAGERRFWRAMKPQPDRIMESLPPQLYWNVGGYRLWHNATNPLRCPYGTPGDRIWLKFPESTTLGGYTITAITVTQRDGKWGWEIYL